MEGLFFFLIIVVLALGVGFLGRNLRIGFRLAFVLALLNFFVGLIAVFLSKKDENDIQFLDINKTGE